MLPAGLILIVLAQEAGVIRYANFAEAGGLKLVGAARARTGVLRLTPAVEFERGAAWRTERIRVREGFETAFRFRITKGGGMGPGADGFAFVIQNNGPDAIAGRGAAGGFGFGDGRGDKTKLAIANSLAVFFDTFQNPEDRSDNSISICTNGDKSEMKWPPPTLAVNWNPKVKLKDGKEHEARIEFRPPLLTVYVDEKLIVRAAVDLGRMVAADGTAYAGFTASTGAGYENHDILDWRFRPTVSSDAFSVSSTISFAPFDCLPGKNLCTPAAAIVEETKPGEYHVILPAHLPWSAEIPNPGGAPVEIRNARGTACWDPAGGACGSPATAAEGKTGALVSRTVAGKTAFSLLDQDFGDNEGYYEFEVIVRK